VSAAIADAPDDIRAHGSRPTRGGGMSGCACSPATCAVLPRPRKLSLWSGRPSPRRPDGPRTATPSTTGIPNSHCRPAGTASGGGALPPRPHEPHGGRPRPSR
jgi:hypothetical protein